MDLSSVVETGLLAEDWAAIRDALWAVGRDSKADLGWLLEQGLDGFIQDEAEWKALEGRPDEAPQARPQELKRREAEALLISMRASTIAAEFLMHELGERVRVLGAAMKEYQRTMWPLRKENAEFEARLRALDESRNGADEAQRGSGPLLDRVREFLKGWRRR